jgi:phosphoesterase RecJ-like protein
MATPQPIPIAPAMWADPTFAQPEALTAILTALRQGERFLVCSHSRPDGDAIGSMLAMGMLLRQMGKRADLVAADRMPVIYRGMPGASEIRTMMRVHGQYDAAILLECDSPERTRLRGLERYCLINIDHHASGKEFAQLNWIDRDACSVGELVYRLVRAAGGEVTAEMATCLYTTLLTDTGGFCYGGVQASTFALAGELVRAGADPVAVARDVYFANPLSKVQLMGSALNTLQREGPLSWLHITHEEMVRVHGAEEDCEGVVNYALSVAGVEAAVFLRELPEGRIRLSLRSKGRVNVAAISQALGGGGHENAAGCTLDGPMSEATEVILRELRLALTEAGIPLA